MYASHVDCCSAARAPCPNRDVARGPLAPDERRVYKELSERSGETEDGRQPESSVNYVVNHNCQNILTCPKGHLTRKTVSRGRPTSFRIVRHLAAYLASSFSKRILRSAFRHRTGTANVDVFYCDSVVQFDCTPFSYLAALPGGHAGRIPRRPRRSRLPDQAPSPTAEAVPACTVRGDCNQNGISIVMAGRRCDKSARRIIRARVPCYPNVEFLTFLSNRLDEIEQKENTQAIDGNDLELPILSPLYPQGIHRLSSGSPTFERQRFHVDGLPPRLARDGRCWLRGLCGNRCHRAYTASSRAEIAGGFARTRGGSGVSCGDHHHFDAIRAAHAGADAPSTSAPRQACSGFGRFTLARCSLIRR